MAFIDEITIEASAGKGGDGIVAWRREKYKPKMGPGGGNGGRGGDVFFEAVRDLGYLENYKFTKKFTAENGGNGGNFGCEGKNGDALVLKVPVGSIVTNIETGDVYELLHEGEQVLVLRGGKGGLGNEHFKSSTNTSPYESTPGREGERGSFSIELQLIADIGLIGFPNAGKSTLINALTQSRSKIGSYQFTTLEPHLGVLPNGKIIADIPGLIEGAHEGKGLGDKFLRHISRTSTITHLVSCEHDDVAYAYSVIRNELGKHDTQLLEKQEIVLLSKTDMCTEEEIAHKKEALEQVSGASVVAFSAYSDDDLKGVLKILTS